VNVLTTSLTGVLVIEPAVYTDARGFFFESYRYDLYAAHGIPDRFVQDNHSRSIRHALRGLHAQITHPQAKLIRVLSGEIFDVVVDIRPGSPTYKKWIGLTLSADNYKQCFVPVGYAHGFCVLSDMAEIEYKATDYYDPAGELHLSWSDPDLAIDWPIKNPLLSEADRSASRLKDIEHRLPRYQPSAKRK
jgi:dTDP-4-dehydrorhamnose 3,5-epimerase